MVTTMDGSQVTPMQTKTAEITPPNPNSGADTMASGIVGAPTLSFAEILALSRPERVISD